MLLLGGQVIAKRFRSTIFALRTVDAGSGIRLDEQDGFKEIRLAAASARRYVGGPDLCRIVRKVREKSGVSGDENDGASTAQMPLTQVVNITQEASDLSMDKDSPCASQPLE